MTAVYIIAGVVLIFFLLTMMGPKAYAVSRSITIKRSAKDIYDFVKFIKNQNEWGPWIKKDPHVQQSYTGTDGEVGFISKWEGNKEVGSGEQEIKAIFHNDRIETELRFLKPWKSQSDAFIKVEEISENVTKVIWGFTGNNKFPFSIFLNF